MTAILTVEGGEIVALAPPAFAERFLSIPDGRVTASQAGHQWVWPATPAHAQRIREALKGAGTLRVDAAFRQLMETTTVLEDGRAHTGAWPRTPLWSHQEEAVQFALHKHGAYFDHQVGAGKSLSAIALMLRREHQKILILVPGRGKLRLVTQWANEIATHAQGLIHSVPLTRGAVPERVRLAETALAAYAPCAIIINYEACLQPAWKQWSLKQSWDLVIADEAHALKAAGGATSRYAALLGKRATYRLALSGTAMANSPLDLYGQMRFVDPSIFGTSWARFRDRYAITGGFQGKEIIGYKNEEELHAKFAQVAHHIETRDVLDLPEERDITISADLSPAGRRHYDAVAHDFFTMVGDGVVTVGNALERLLRLQQLTSGYLPDAENNATHLLDETKADLLGELLDEFPEKEPVVVFTRFHHDLDATAHVATAGGRRYGELSGRRSDLDAFVAGDIDVLGVQIQAGAEGLNDLVRARYAIFYSLGFSLSQYQQARGRLMRPRQRNDVTFYHLVIRNSVDEAVMRALERKEDVIRSILAWGKKR